MPRSCPDSPVLPIVKHSLCHRLRLTVPIVSGAVALCFAFQQDTVPPQLTITEPARNSVLSTNLIRFKAEASDSQSGIAQVGFVIRSFSHLDTTEDDRTADTVAILHAPPWECIVDMRGLPDQDMWRLVPAIWALDSAGNRSEDFVRYVVLDRNPDTSLRMTTAAFTTVPIQIDGILAEWCALADSFTNGNNTILFGFCWDAACLYAAARIRDSDIVTVEQASPWLFDDIELYFDTRRDRSPIRQPDDKQIIVTAGGGVRPWFVDIVADTQYIWSDRIAVAVAPVTDGYAVELAVPWSELLESRTPEAGMAMGFDLFNSDRDGRSSYRTGLSWAGNPRHNNSNPSEWGTLVLGRPGRAGVWLMVGLGCAAAGAAAALFYRGRRLYPQTTVATAAGSLSASEHLARDTKAYLQKHFKDESLRLTTVARALGLNANYLSGVFKKTTGISFPRYLNSIRLREAKRLLRETSSSVTEIALEVGFSSPNSLQRLFRQEEKCSPREYRKKTPHT